MASDEEEWRRREWHTRRERSRVGFVMLNSTMKSREIARDRFLWSPCEGLESFSSLFPRTMLSRTIVLCLAASGAAYRLTVVRPAAPAMHRHAAVVMQVRHAPRHRAPPPPFFAGSALGKEPADGQRMARLSRACAICPAG